MSVTYGFYNSKNHDRRYNALQMSMIFDGIIRDGVLQHVGTALMVKESEDMIVNVGIGRAWFNHTWTYNDALLPLEVPISEILLNRIDAVVLEVDSRENYRRNTIKIIKGTPSNNPQNPALVKEKERWQYPLAYIKVMAGTKSIRQANITNTVGTSACPFVTAPLEKMSIDDLIAQWGDQWKAFYEEKTTDMNEFDAFWKDQWRKWYAAQTSAMQQSFQNFEDQWEQFYNEHANEVEETADYWKDLWKEWFYDYVNNSTRELAYWKKLVTDDFVEYSTFWKKEWQKWFEAQAGEVQEAFEDWENQWRTFFESQTADMQATAKNWEMLWEGWFYDYVNESTTEYTAWKNSIDRDFRDWWNSIQDLLDAKDVSVFAEKLVELQERTESLEDFRKELTDTHSIYDNLMDSNGNDITDQNTELINGKRVVFVVDTGEDVYAELEKVTKRLTMMEQILNGVVNEFTAYQILVDGGTWMYVDNPEADQTDQILDQNGDPIMGKTLFVMK